MKKTNNNGFTFIELVIYIGILSVFLVAVVTLVGSTVFSNRKLTAKKKLQNEASETYDAISDMLMGATDVMIYGSATLSNGTSTTGYYIVPDSTDTTDASSKILYVTQTNGQEGKIQKTVSTSLGNFTPAVTECYDIADITSYGGVAGTSEETEVEVTNEDGETVTETVVTTTTVDIEDTYITADSDGSGYLCMYIKYASDLVDNSTTDSKDTIYTYCTLVYDSENEVIYINKTTDTSKEGTFVYDSSNSDVLCKDVKSFTLQVNPDEDSFSITIELADDITSKDYSISGVVNLRNSYVLTKHTWS